jgi:S1-C subfamily serine protease
LKIIYLLLLIALTALADKNTASTSVVKIFTSVSIPDYSYPYQSSKISKFSGSGVIIDDHKILTSAHIVSGARFIELQKESDPNRYIAKVKYISNQADLAVLEVNDKSFFKNTTTLKLSEDIYTHDKVTVIGYPLGGDTLSTTTGVVSRIEYINYVWSNFYLLAIQVDAAVNQGNSGGAVLNSRDELVGIVMMRLLQSSNISYIVPAVVINTFLEDIKDGVVDGFHSDSILHQDISNKAQKKYYAMDKKSGVVITYVGVDEKLLKVDDVILGVDGKDIANNATVLTKYAHIDFSFLYHTKQLGDTVKIKILRDKKEMLIEYTLKRVEPLIRREFGKEPRYIIYGGFIFTPLTDNYLRRIYKSSSGLNMLFYQKRKTADYDEPVVSLSTIFPHEVNRGYFPVSNVLERVNGIKIKNFKHLVNILNNMSDEFTIFEFLEKRKVILNTKDAKKSIKDILDIYGIKSDRRE